MLLLTCLYVCDRSGIVKWAGEKASPTGGPAGITHGSRMAGVSPQASAALCCVPHLPDMSTQHQAKVTNLPQSTKTVAINYFLLTVCAQSWRKALRAQPREIHRIRYRTTSTDYNVPNCQIHNTRFYQWFVSSLWLNTSVIYRRKKWKTSHTMCASGWKLSLTPASVTPHQKPSGRVWQSNGRRHCHPVLWANKKKGPCKPWMSFLVLYRLKYSRPGVAATALLTEKR